MRIKLFLLLITLIAFLAYYSFNVESKEISRNENNVNDNSWVEQKLSSMTLREKIAQMIISYSDGYTLSKDSKEYERLSDLIRNLKIGGLIFFKGNSLQEATLINDLQSLSETPLLISADFERGTKMRLDDGSLFPSNMALGATRNTEFAYKMGNLIAGECRAMGIHQNYSPVLDVNTNPKNPIVNVRSFGDDPNLVSEMGIMMIKGLQDGGVIATGKHFPGHGGTDIDSHNDLPVLNTDIDNLNEVELVPFKNAISAGLKSVMIAHLSFPSIEKNTNVPASLSGKIVQEILIDQLGFDGLIITDALNMPGVTKHFNTQQVAVMSVLAGIDLILMPQGEELTINSIEDAVKKGTITEEMINKSVKKILEAKKWLGLNENKFVKTDPLKKIINSDDEKALSQQIADESITLVKNEQSLVPFKPVIRNMLIISLNNGNDKANSDYFLQEFKSKTDKIITGLKIFDEVGEIDNINEVLNSSNEFDYVLIPVYAKIKIKTGTVGLPQTQTDLINKLIETKKKIIMISFGNPYLLQGFTGVNTYICAYGDCESSINSAVNAIFGEIRFKGRLPVSINDTYKFGTGISN